MEKQNGTFTRRMIAMVLAVTIIWIGSFFFIITLCGLPKDAGTAGDLFGAVGALFSGWAFVGVVCAILLQRKSLQIQHNDLMLTLKEMQQTKEAHKESAEALQKQNEINQIRIQVDILKTLIETDLQINKSGNNFLGGHRHDYQDAFGSGNNGLFVKYLNELDNLKKNLQEHAK